MLKKSCLLVLPGGGLANMWSSMLEKNLMWNGGGDQKWKNCMELC